MRPPFPASPAHDGGMPPASTAPRRLPAEGETPLLASASIRELESRFIAGDDPGALMARAGRSLARLAMAIAPHAPLYVFECGPGHNGGDGLIAAAALARQGRAVRLVTAFDAADATTVARLPAAVRLALGDALTAGCDLGAGHGDPPRDSLCIDALLGIGASRPPEGRILEGIRRLRAHRGRVLAVDVPSGLHADSGRILGEGVVAHDTLTFIAAKPGLFTAAGRDHAGRVWLEDLALGAHVEALASPPSIRLGGLATESRHRMHTDHKGSLGDVLVVGGAPGMAGALVLAAGAAHAAGAGRVWCISLGADVRRSVPIRNELMHLDIDSLADATVLSGRTVVAGCGGGEPVASALSAVLRDAPRVVLDADGLNAVARDPTLRRALTRRAIRGAQTVITPHPLEAARLLGCTAAEVQGDRLVAARSLSESLGATVVLKGSGTVVAQQDRLWINATGGPALATPGSGDVLAGWIGGLWAAGDADSGWWACREACRLHGRVAEAVTDGPLRAADLIEWMWARHAGIATRGSPSA